MEEFFRSLRLSMSNERLAVYREENDVAVFSKYIHNIERNESIYPCIHLLEVALRNAIDRRLAALYGATWYDVILDPEEKNQVDDARQKIRRKGRPETPGRVISELTFGFWTYSLFKRRYDQRVWHRIIRDVFPTLRNRDRNRQTVSAKLHPIRDLRNSVFHHEPIWRFHNLEALHRDIHEVINWINPDISHIASLVDKFPQVTARPNEHYQTLLMTKIAELRAGIS